MSPITTEGINHVFGVLVNGGYLPGWKLLDRCEPSMSTLDETKQLRVWNFLPDTYKKVAFSSGQGTVSLTKQELSTIGSLISLVLTHYKVPHTFRLAKETYRLWASCEK